MNPLESIHDQALLVSAACAGEALIDLIAKPKDDPDDAGERENYEACLGGAIYNLSRALAMQGVATTYLNPISSDHLGRQLQNGLQAARVTVAEPAAVEQSTSLAVVSLSPNGHPTYSFYRHLVADRATSYERLNTHCDALADLRIVCCGCLALSPTDAGIYLPWLQTQRKAGRMVVVDANVRAVAFQNNVAAYFENIAAALQLADVIKVSDEDLKHLQAALDLLGTPLEQAKILLARTPARVVLLTLGAQGAWLLHKDGVECFGALKGSVDVIDTVGAGDCFLAGALAKMSRHPDLLRARSAAHWQQVLVHAIASASVNVTRKGCQPPTWDEAKAWASRVGTAPLT